MIEMKSKIVRKGDSFVVIIPNSIVENEKYKEGDEISLLLRFN